MEIIVVAFCAAKELCRRRKVSVGMRVERLLLAASIWAESCMIEVPTKDLLKRIGRVLS